jgi:imidazolonepropionase-like amidohydrolase
LYDLRNAINQGVVSGPRIFGAQAQIVVSGGDYDPVALGAFREGTLNLINDDGVCDGVDGCRRAVRREIRRGADVIKVRISGAGTDIGTDALYESREELQSIIDTAHSLNRTVAVHSHTPAGSRLALELGADTIEHGLPAPADFGLFHRKGGTDAWFVPTLTAFSAIREMLLKMTGKDWYALAANELKAAYQAGVPIAFGTDAGAFPHAQAVLEFGLMVDAGMSNVDVLKAATVNAAAALRQSPNLGSIAPGKWGDLVAVPANPLEDIHAMERVFFVMKAGVAQP